MTKFHQEQYFLKTIKYFVSTGNVKQDYGKKAELEKIAQQQLYLVPSLRVRRPKNTERISLPKEAGFMASLWRSRQ